MQSNFKNKLGILILIVLAVYSVFYHKNVSSSVSDNTKGYAWGSDKNGADPTGGLGWLSFNCTNEPGSCANGENYGVNINPSTLDVTGYAWSNNYGWVKFGGLSGFPTSGVGTTQANAKFVGTVVGGVFNGYLTGWARFCSPAANADNCLGFIENDQNGGWDGWLSLKGSNYGITVTNNVFSGYAWGGNNNNKNVVGWVSFSGTTPIYNVNIAEDNTVLDFYALPSPSVPPFTATLHWNSLDETNFTTCTADSSSVNPTHPNAPTETLWNGALSTTLPASFSVNVPYNPTNYKITCVDPSSNQYTSTISVPRFQNEKLTLSNTKVVGGVTTLSWNITNASSCTASTVNPTSGTGWTGSISNSPSSGSQSGISVTAVAPEKTTYILSCVGDFSSQNISVSLDLHTTSGSSTNTKIPVYKEN